MADKNYFIVGGGSSSAKAAVAIRALDGTGSVMLATRENRYPYDRPPLSKNLLQNDAVTAEDPESKDPTWYSSNNVEVWKGIEVGRIVPSEHLVEFVDGGRLTYEKLLLATGSTAIRPELNGIELENVFLLRTVDDALQIRQAIQRGGRAVMIGGGYVGMEVAASATTRGVHCTVIERGDRPWARFAGPAASGYVRSRYEEEGVAFKFGDEAAGLVGEGKVSGVQLKSGETLPADFVVIGIGVTQNTLLAHQAGLSIDPNGGVVVNEFLQTSDPDIYAAGDIAAYVDKYTGQRMHVEHHMNAGWTGSTAGTNMTGRSVPFDRVAYFYSDAFDIHMALRGTPGGQLAHTVGDVKSGNFVELYADGNRLQMGLAVSREESKLDPVSDKLEALIAEGAGIDQVNLADFASIA